MTDGHGAHLDVSDAEESGVVAAVVELGGKMSPKASDTAGGW